MTHKEFLEVKRIVNEEINMYDYNTPYHFILFWLENHCKNKLWSDNKSSKAPRITTYGLKHSIECDWPYKNDNYKNWQSGHGYCANNWVKCALYEMGYDLKDETHESTNITFEDMLNNSVNYYYRLH